MSPQAPDNGELDDVIDPAPRLIAGWNPSGSLRLETARLQCAGGDTEGREGQPPPWAGMVRRSRADNRGSGSCPSAAGGHGIDNGSRHRDRDR